MSQYIEEVGYSQGTWLAERRQSSRRAAEDRRRREVEAFLDTLAPTSPFGTAARSRSSHPFRFLAAIVILLSGIALAAHFRRGFTLHPSSQPFDTELLSAASYKWARFHRVEAD